MVSSAFRGYFDVWHGNHVYREGDVTNPDTIGTVIDSLENSRDIASLPGIINIPVCTWQEIKDNWKKGPPSGEDSDTYPCNHSGS
jgi:hypothetical protein